MFRTRGRDTEWVRASPGQPVLQQYRPALRGARRCSERCPNLRMAGVTAGPDEGERQCDSTDFNPRLVLDEEQSQGLLTAQSTSQLEASNTALIGTEAQIDLWIEYDDPACARSCGLNPTFNSCAPLRSGKLVSTTEWTHDELPTIAILVTAPDAEVWNRVTVASAPRSYSAYLGNQVVESCNDHTAECGFSARSDSTVTFEVPSAPPTAPGPAGPRSRPADLPASV